MKEKIRNAEFAKRLKDIRKSRRIQLKDAALDIEMTPQTLIKYERGYLEPSLTTLIRFCDLYNISPNYLLTGNDENSAQITELSKRKIYNLLSLAIDGDIVYDYIHSNFRFTNESIQKNLFIAMQYMWGQRNTANLKLLILF
ncbi:MAG: helix-turn-helix transcriptional regulator [Bacilli bacterium]|jgi:transcriptional regulator with XRE-family HTH domain|nr:helix-turn-helix transcriptional regulator [Bacilli bacterium]MDD3422285.1 helix-turn-helix transcriptional regulator [Bacilli bacterium]MDD4065916.1 helix-turn-helix transcriptional regulator [Bacilli bacterium]